MSVEEVFHLRKDTLVYIIFDNQIMESFEHREITKKSFEKHGYTNINYQPYPNLNEDQGYKLNFIRYNESVAVEKKKWYAFVNVLRKVRKEDKPVIITFAGNILDSDIPADIEKRDLEILGYAREGINRKSKPKSGIFITPLKARELLKKYLLTKRIAYDLNREMVNYYNQLNNHPDKKYHYLLMKDGRRL